MLFNHPKPFNLTIENPCQQSWDDMQATGGGKFCAHCSKTVVDFTQMTDAALFDYVKKNGLGCGRFLDTQLNRIIAPPVVPKRKFWPQLLLSIGMIFGFVKGGNTQSLNTGYQTIQAEIKPDTANKKEERINGDFIIKGTITDEKGNLLPSAQITISTQGIQKGSTITNFDGEYVIKLAKNELKMNQTFEINAKWQNFAMTLVEVLSDQRQKVNFKLNTKPTKNLTMGMIIIATKPNMPPLINPKNPTVRARRVD